MSPNRMSRRGLLFGSAATLFPAPDLALGVMDGVLRLSGKPEAIEVAAKAGVPAIQVTLKEYLEHPELVLEAVSQAARHGVTINATYLDLLHQYCLKSNPVARRKVSEAIAATKQLKAPILMTVFFGQCALENRQETDYVAGVFTELAQEAAAAGVVLGFENVLPVAENIRVVDRVNSPAFRIYYDVGNATNLIGEDAPAAIRDLGPARICQFHFKDKGYLGEGKVNFPEVLKAIRAIGFRGYANLETSSPSQNALADLQRNLSYLRGLMR